jgi:hypothetical protein
MDIGDSMIRKEGGTAKKKKKIESSAPVYVSSNSPKSKITGGTATKRKRK